jgi:hypothetical protein
MRTVCRLSLMLIFLARLKFTVQFYETAPTMKHAVGCKLAACSPRVSMQPVLLSGIKDGLPPWNVHKRFFGAGIGLRRLHAYRKSLKPMAKPPS